MLSPEIYTRARDCQSLDSTHRSGTGVPQKNFNRENLKFALKFSVLATIPGASGSIPTKHFPYDVPPGKGHNIGINFGRPCDKGRLEPTNLDDTLQVPFN